MLTTQDWYFKNSKLLMIIFLPNPIKIYNHKLDKASENLWTKNQNKK